jgi:uncharacterized protein YggE
MSPIPRIFIFLATATAAFAQLDSNSVTVSASRNTSLQADQAVFAIYVNSGLNVNLTDVVAAVQSAGLTLSNFQSVSTTQSGFIQVPGGPTGIPSMQPALQWVFALPVPVSKIKDTATALNTLQQSIAQSKNGMTMSFSVAGTQVSPGLQQSQVCAMPDLLSDARAQAQKLAEAANMTVGAILAMSSSTATVLPGSGVPITAYLGSLTSTSLLNSQLGAGCFVTVKFALK